MKLKELYNRQKELEKEIEYEEKNNLYVLMVKKIYII